MCIRDRFPTAQPYKPYNRVIAQKLLATSVVKNALSVTGTPFLYKPSRLLGAMGTRNNQETTWTDALDAEHFDQYRPGMEGCFRCPVNCRPLNDLHSAVPDKYDKGDGPEYVTLGKFGPNLGVASVESVIRLNNICNDLGLDTASTGSALTGPPYSSALKARLSLMRALISSVARLRRWSMPRVATARPRANALRIRASCGSLCPRPFTAIRYCIASGG